VTVAAEHPSAGATLRRATRCSNMPTLLNIARSPRARAGAMLALASLCLAALAPRAGAAIIASSVRGLEGGPALASDGRVVVGELRGNGALAILAIDPRTRAVTELTSYPPLADPLTYNDLHVVGTGGPVTATLLRTREATGVQSGAEQDIPVPKSSRTTLLLPAVAPLFDCGRRTVFSLREAAAGDGFLATVGSECLDASQAVTLRTPSATITIPVAPEPPSQFSDTPTPRISDLRAAGPFVAWVEVNRTGPGGQFQYVIVVARGATGQVLLRTAIPEPPPQIGLGADGTVAFTRLFCLMGVMSPAAPAVRTFRLPADLCAYSQSSRSLAVAGGRIVFGASTGYAISDIAGTGARPLGEATPRGGNVASPVAFDGRTAYVIRPDCGADRLLAVDADAAAGPLPTREQTVELACPVYRAGPRRVRAGRSGRVRIALRCPEGCRGTLRLVQRRRGGRERIVGEASYATNAGTVVVAVRTASWARALAGCPGGLVANAVYFPARTSPRTTGQPDPGAYRVTSSARCRRSGGPAFAKPRRGPRP